MCLPERQFCRYSYNTNNTNNIITKHRISQRKKRMSSKNREHINTASQISEILFNFLINFMTEVIICL